MNERSEREIQEKIPFATASERIKHLGINLPKETCKMLMKEIKEHKQMEIYTIFLDWKNHY